MRWLLSVLIFFNLSPALATLKLELTQGVAQPIPIAVIPITGIDSTTRELNKVIRANLARSGQFQVLDLPASSTVGTDQKSAHLWSHQSVDYVVQTQVTPMSDGHYQINFALMQVIRIQRALLRQQFIVSSNQLRAVAHCISDKVFYQLLGIPGIFSTRIAYVLVQKQHDSTDYTLQVADADGYNPKPLLRSSQPIVSPAWSPDGRRIAYVSFEQVTPYIYIQEVASGARQVISHYPGINGAPAWSPDGTQLALALSHGTASPNIYLMDLATKRLRQITFGNSIDTEPSWSPDGKSLLFTSDRGGGLQIYQTVVATGEVKRLTFSGHYNARASFSPDGKAIVMLTRDQEHYHIGLQDLRTGYLRSLTHTDYDISPSLAPNGRMVLYESRATGEGVLKVTSMDGKIDWRLPTPQGSIQDPRWSPYSHPR